MKINELLESKDGTLSSLVADALPATFVLPQLTNQDPYKQYRMGIALAAAGMKKSDTEYPFNTESAFGENLTVTAYSPEEEQMFTTALKLLGRWEDYKLISTRKSQEPNFVNKVSPIRPQPPLGY